MSWREQEMHISDGDVPRVALCGKQTSAQNLTSYALDSNCHRCMEFIDQQLQRISFLQTSKDTINVASSIRAWISENTTQVIDQILETEDGLLLLHHTSSRA